MHARSPGRLRLLGLGIRHPDVVFPGSELDKSPGSIGLGKLGGSGLRAAFVLWPKAYLIREDLHETIPEPLLKGTQE